MPNQDKDDLDIDMPWPDRGTDSAFIKKLMDKHLKENKITFLTHAETGRLILTHPKAGVLPDWIEAGMAFLIQKYGVEKSEMLFRIFMIENGYRWVLEREKEIARYHRSS